MFGFNPPWRNPVTLAISLMNQSQQVMVMHMLDLICQHHKITVDLIQFAPLEVITKLLAAQTESVTPGVLSQHQLRIWHPNRLWCHDFIRQPVLEHAVLMNASFMGKRIPPNDRLVRLHRNARDLLQHLARRIQLLCSNASLVCVVVCSHP